LLLLGMQRVCSVAVLRSGNTWLISGIYGTALVAKLLLNFWLIPWWGAIGAGIASSLTYVLSAVLFLVWTVRLAQVPAHTMLPQRADIALFASALWGLVRHLGKSAPKA
jgi:O-antigen/teichoic acid export membrane protein